MRDGESAARAAAGSARSGEAAAEPRTDPQPPTLQLPILSGLGWKAVSQIVFQSTSVLVMLTLVRLLGPRDYGLAMMVLVFSAFVFILSDLALGTTLIQRRSISDADLSTVFWTNVVAGALFTAAGVAASGAIADFYGEPELKPLVAVLSLSFLVSSIGTTQNALLVRKMDFRSVELRRIAGWIAGGAVGVTLAALGSGPWAIVAQQLVIAAVSTALVWRFSSWRPSPVYSLDSLRAIAGFSANVFGTNLLERLRFNTDRLLVGRVLGASALGVYSFGFTIVLFPVYRLGSPVAEVLLPVLSRLQDDGERLAAVWLRAVRYVAGVIVPALVGLIVVAPDLVDVVLDDEWEDAARVVQLLAVVGIVGSLQFLNGIVLQALDRTRMLLAWSTTAFAATLVALGIGLRYGIVTVAAAVAVSTTLVSLPYSWHTARVLGVTTRRLTATFLPVAQVAAAVGTLAFVARLVLLELAVPTAPRFAVLVLLGLALFVVLVLRQPDVSAELHGLRARRTRSQEERREEHDALPGTPALKDTA